MSQENTAEYPENVVWRIDVKIERTAKGARHTVHARSNNLEKAMREAIEAYDRVGAELSKSGHQLAPIETMTEKATKEPKT